ncbi:MAG: Tol-Pal system protein TolB, partial [Pseudomonadota bacterium]
EVLHRGDTREPLDGQETNRLSLVTLHYSALADSQSVMFGNFITPLGGGQYQLSGGTRKYGPLDQYLMGLRAPEETPPMRVLDDGSGMGAAEMPLRRGETKTASALDEVWVSVADVVRAQGPRLPAFPDARRCFRVAFVLVLAPGATTATAEQLARVEAYRTRWESWFLFATDGRAATVTTLDPAAACPAPLLPAADAGTAGEDAGSTEQDAGGPTQDGGTSAQDAGNGQPDTGKLKPGCGCNGAGAAPWLVAFALWALRASRRRD